MIFDRERIASFIAGCLERNAHPDFEPKDWRIIINSLRDTTAENTVSDTPRTDAEALRLAILAAAEELADDWTLPRVRQEQALAVYGYLKRQPELEREVAELRDALEGAAVFAREVIVGTQPEDYGKWHSYHRRVSQNGEALLETIRALKGKP